MYNLPLAPGVLPPNLTHLNFGQKFNQTLTPGVLPPSLTHLTFSFAFNQPLEMGTLPPNLEQLTLGTFFNQPLTRVVLPDAPDHPFSIPCIAGKTDRTANHTHLPAPGHCGVPVTGINKKDS